MLVMHGLWVCFSDEIHRSGRNAHNSWLAALVLGIPRIDPR